VVHPSDCRDYSHRYTNDDIVYGWVDQLTIVAVIGTAGAGYKFNACFCVIGASVGFSCIGEATTGNIT